jgi:hypothetical protein
VERVLLKAFPAEATSLLCELQWALGPSNSKKLIITRRKRSRDQVEEKWERKEESLKRRGCMSSA